MSQLISLAGTAIGSIGIFIGFYFLSSNPQLSLKIVTSSAVGIVGTLAFIRHFVFHKSDAKRLGWETERPDWIFEVGFANLAFGIIGFLSVFANFGKEAQSLALIGYSAYLFQAGILHGYRYFTDEKKYPVRLWKFSIFTLLYAGMMTFFALNALDF
ncbi:MAG: hypothetical protein C0412_07625 [Flavobacterium sp.]|nr:hypothetical protein [Flavobacterium sp.]